VFGCAWAALIFEQPESKNSGEKTTPSGNFTQLQHLGHRKLAPSDTCGQENAAQLG
jgi:hypothetical protein